MSEPAIKHPRQMTAGELDILESFIAERRAELTPAPPDQSRESASRKDRSRRFRDIAELSAKQRLGAFSTESDASTALLLIERLSSTLAEE